MLLVFVLVGVAAELPDAAFGSCCGFYLPVIWGSETGRRGVRKEDERWKRRDKVEYSASFYLLQTPSLCVCCLIFVRDVLVAKAFFCRDSIWVMLIRAGGLDL